MNIGTFFYRMMRRISKKSLYLSLVLSTCLVLASCGGDSDTGDDSIIDGTGVNISGVAAVGAPIVNAEVTISVGDDIFTTTTDVNGRFRLEDIDSFGPFISRVEISDNEYLYGVGHFDGGFDVTVNIHPYTDIVVRNWFSVSGIEIGQSFSDNVNFEFPTLFEIIRIQLAIENIISTVIADYNLPSDFDFMRTPFDADSTGFDLFLDNSSITIINNLLTVVVVDLVTNIEIILVDGVDLTEPLPSPVSSVEPIPMETEEPVVSDLEAPTVPMNVRATVQEVTEMSGSLIITWDAASDNVAVSGYNIYRNSEFIATTAFPVYTDSDLALGVEYSYSVEAIDSSENLSALSDASNAVVLDEPDTTAPSVPTDVTLLESSGRVILTWQQEDLMEVSAFRITRGAETEYAQTTSTSYTDINVEAGNTYCYRVLSFDGAENESENSDEQCITLSGDAGLSTVSFSQNGYLVSEDDGVISIPVIRTGALDEVVTVDYTITPDTADINEDYLAASGTLTWGVNDGAAKNIDVQVFTDLESETLERVNLVLENPSMNNTLGEFTDVFLSIENVEMTCVELSPTRITESTFLDEVCYEVNSSVTVENGATLTIAPGTILVMSESIALSVQSDGVLNASGTESDPITFTSEIRSPGYWSGITIDSVADSILNNVLIEYAGALGGFAEASVYIGHGARAQISNSIIRYSANYGIEKHEDGSLVDFEANQIVNNWNAPVSMDMNSLYQLDDQTEYTGNSTEIGDDRNYIRVVDQTVTRDQSWKRLGVPYRFVSSTHNSVNAVLTIEPGVSLVFASDANFSISNQGTLNAVGTEAQPITFTGYEPIPGYWSGIQIDSSNNHIMDYTIVEYGGSGETGNTDSNIGVFLGDRLTIRNSIIRHSLGYGMDLNDDILLGMSNVTFTDNNRPIILSSNDQWQLDAESTFTGNADDRIFLRDNGIEVDQIISDLGVPYLSFGLITVDADLEITEGVEIQFASSAGFSVSRNASLRISGAETNRVLLTGEDKIAGAWRGIQYSFTNSLNNVIDFATIEYGGDTGGNTEALVGYFGSDTYGEISNTIFRESSTNGIERDSETTGDITVNNTFENITGENVFID